MIIWGFTLTPSFFYSFFTLTPDSEDNTNLNHCSPITIPINRLLVFVEFLRSLPQSTGTKILL